MIHGWVTFSGHVLKVVFMKDLFGWLSYGNQNSEKVAGNLVRLFLVTVGKVKQE